MKFGKLILSVENTANGRGFDINYQFSENHKFVEFVAKKEFMFIQPWMQFPSQEYTDECKLVSIELVNRFNTFEEVKSSLESTRKQLEAQQAIIDQLRKISDSYDHNYVEDCYTQVDDAHSAGFSSAANHYKGEIFKILEGKKK